MSFTEAQKFVDSDNVVRMYFGKNARNINL